MIKQTWTIDEQGFYLGESTFINEEEMTDLMITTPILIGYIKPKWNGIEWVEGATEEEIQAWKDANILPIQEPNKTEILEANVLNLQKLCIGLQKQIILK